MQKVQRLLTPRYEPRERPWGRSDISCLSRASDQKNDLNREMFESFHFNVTGCDVKCSIRNSPKRKTRRSRYADVQGERIIPAKFIYHFICKMKIRRKIYIYEVLQLFRPPLYTLSLLTRPFRTLCILGHWWGNTPNNARLELENRERQRCHVAWLTENRRI